tara:strand:- start:257 stop:655 length:399 start_codon:yes stop_codon:yes gene_type:complete
MEINPLIPVGSKIKVDKSKIENMVSNQLIDNLPKMINGEVIDYKMTDGMGIGYVLLTENNEKIWIFNHELNEQTKREYSLKDDNEFKYKASNELILGKYKLEYKLDGNKDIKTIANPFNLISWLVFTLKDIF